MRNASGNWYIKHLTYVSEDSYVGTVHSEDELRELEDNNVEVEEAHLEIPDEVIKDIRRNDPDRPTFKITIGDEYNDGHGRFEVVNVRSNLDKEVIDKALSKANLKLPWLSDICSNYEDDCINEERTAELKSLGVNLDNIEDCSRDETKLYLTVDGFVQLHLEIARVFLDEELEYSIISDSTPELSIGSSGYGLFS